LAESSPDIVFLLSPDGLVLYLNPIGARQFGRPPDERPGVRLDELFPVPMAARYLAAVQYVVKTGQTYLAESPEALASSGLWIETRLVPVRGPAGGIAFVMGIARDVSHRRRVEEALRAGELRYRSLFEESPLALWEEDFSEVRRRMDDLRKEGVVDFATYVDANPALVPLYAGLVKVIDVNRATLALYHAASKEELLGDINRTFTEDSLRMFRDELVVFAQGRYRFESETETRTLDGGTNYVAVRVTVAPGYEHTFGRVIVSMYDLTERKRAEEQQLRIRELERANVERVQEEARIRATLREKEVLLREIHHRVKNNLQVIASLLRLGGERVGDPQAREIFRDSQSRIRSMALIHERLYLTGDLARVPFREYLHSLTRELFSAHNAWARGVRLKLDVDDTILTLDVAIPCGLIIHELVNNSLEHAFPATAAREGAPAEKHIGVVFRHRESGHYDLEVADDGIGMPPAAQLASHQSLGLELVDALVHQVGGTLTRDPGGGGCRVRITFAERSAR
jgi:polar amino acid transport system substrate-binding protein